MRGVEEDERERRKKGTRRTGEGGIEGLAGRREWDADEDEEKRWVKGKRMRGR